MSLAKKLNLKDGMKVRVIGKPADVDLGDVVTTSSAKAEAILVFVKTAAEVDAKCAPVIEAAKEDRLAWVAYPKAGQLGTDLNRDVLWKQLENRGIEGVRLVALDAVWSAMRFRPEK
jgi:phage-related baseplate assembly protein